VLDQFSLKTRRFIGPTSTVRVCTNAIGYPFFTVPCTQVAELAFIMANMGKADHGKQVYDPFVGTGDSRATMHQPTVFVCALTQRVRWWLITGSLLVASAQFGAMTLGADIDFRIVHGIQRGLSILSSADWSCLYTRLISCGTRQEMNPSTLCWTISSSITYPRQVRSSHHPAPL